MVMELARMEQPESLDIKRVCRFVHQTELAPGEILTLPVEVDGHRAQERQL